jgi:ParB family chromosome partitioning protein
MIPIARIRVINARARNKVKFQEIVTNISKLGLKKPITVARRTDGEDGFDLVCGQGRLEAYVALAQAEVPALVIDAANEDRYIMSLVENLARPNRTSLELARAIQDLRDRGYGTSDVAVKVGLSDKYVADLYRLVDQGEERLIEAVERGDIPLGVATEIASSQDGQIQRSLMEAYESGKLRGRALMQARRLADLRRVRGKSLASARANGKAKPVSADDLVRTYRRETQRQQLMVKKARVCERQLRFITAALKDLLHDEGLVTLLRAEGLDTLPKYLANTVGQP